MSRAEVARRTLRSHEAKVEVGPTGLVVRVPAFGEGDADVVALAAAVLSLWRTVVRAGLGFRDES